MTPLVEQNRDSLASLCREFHVLRLELFGSAAATGHFDPDTSDLDFLVTFPPATPGELAKRFFGLLARLESLFGRHVDLVEPEAIRNPYFLQHIQASRTLLYDGLAQLQSDLQILSR